jgi:hypothetical protein
MSLNLQCEPRETYLYVRFTGVFALREAEDLSLRFLDACFEHGKSKALIDIRSVEGDPTTMERWEYSVFIANQVLNYRTSGRLQYLRLAYLGSLPLIDPLKFGETVAVNRGLNVKATTDIDVAFAWLEFVPGTRLDARADR